MELHASGRAASAALHAAVLEPGIAHLALHQAPLSYQQLLKQPTTKDAYSEVVPSVLRHYDLPELRRALGGRLLLP